MPEVTIRIQNIKKSIKDLSKAIVYLKKLKGDARPENCDTWIKMLMDTRKQLILQDS